MARPKDHAEAGGALGAVAAALGRALLFVVAVVVYWMIASLGYMAVRWSGENLPLALHLAVLGCLAGLVVWGIVVTGRSDLRAQHRAALREWFGPHVLIVLPLLILITATSVFASATWLLLGAWPELLCSPEGHPVTEGNIADFYLWHFLDLVPILDIPGTLRWQAPLDYTSRWAGLLVLAFQGVVVVPSIGAIRAYFKGSRESGRD